jgi:hypothetical protein
MTTTITASQLAQYYGSEQFFFNPLFRSIKYTEGVKYLSDNGAAWLITDILAVLKGDRKVKAEEFVSICFTVKDRAGVILMTDGNDKELYKQLVEYTDFPIAEVKMFYTSGVLMLSSEY